jgi:hypothetical protein
MSKNIQTKWWLDLLIFIGFLIAMEPRSSGLAIHEWLTLTAFITILIHLLLNWNWVAQVTTRFFTSNRRVQLNYLINWLLFVDGILIMLSGLMISERVIPAFGLSFPRNFAWRGLHDLSANLALLLLGLHTALHWSWIVNTFNRLFLQPLRTLFHSRSAQKEGKTL